MLVVCLFVGFITMLDVSIVNVALPSIEHGLHAGPGQLQLVVAGYMLAFGLALVPAGRLGDAGSRRAIFMTGLTGFALTSLAAGLAPDDTTLVVARLLQGASAGLLNPNVIGLFQQMFTGVERGRAFGLFGTSISVSTALGPVLGGVIIAVAGAENGWRWIFGINVPIVAVALVLAWRVLPRTPPRPGPRRLDGVGLVLLALAVVTVMLPFVLTTGVGDDPARWWWLVVAAVMTAAAVLWERGYHRRTGAAVLDPRVIRVPVFRNGALLGTAYYGGFSTLFLVVTLHFQRDLGYTPLHAGLIGMPFAVGAAVTSGLSGRWVARYGRALVVTGLVTVLVGIAGAFALVHVVGEDARAAAGWGVAVAMLVAGSGSGVVISANQTLTLSGVPSERSGAAAGVLQVGSRIGGAVGLATVLSTYYATRAGGATGAAAAGYGLCVTGAFVAVALVCGVVDLRDRRAAPRS